MGRVNVDDIGPVGIAALGLLSKNRYGLKGETRFQKYAFLLDKMINDEELDEDFNFIPHDFGPWSESLRDILDRLQNYELVNKIPNTKPNYILTVKGESLLHDIQKRYSKLLETAEIISNDFRNFSDDDVISMVYELYPNFTTSSMIKDRVKNCANSDFFEIPYSQKDGEFEIITRCGNKIIADKKGDKIKIKGA